MKREYTKPNMQMLSILLERMIVTSPPNVPFTDDEVDEDYEVL